MKVCAYPLGVGDPGRLLGPVSAAWGLKELVLTVGMALLTRRPQVAMLMFICGARKKVLPEDRRGKAFRTFGDFQQWSLVNLWGVKKIFCWLQPTDVCLW